MSGTCPFCRWQSQNVLEETKNFCLIADLYPLSEGHSLIITKQHCVCMGELEGAEQVEFLKLRAYAQAQLEKIYGWVSFWENGGMRQTVQHAHLHLIPLAKDNRLDFSAKIWQAGRIVRLESWKALFEWHKTNGVYQLFCNGGDEPPHLLRPQPNWKMNGVDEADWVRLKQLGTWRYIKRRVIRRGSPEMRQQLKIKWQTEAQKEKEQSFVSG